MPTHDIQLLLVDLALILVLARLLGALAKRLGAARGIQVVPADSGDDAVLVAPAGTADADWLVSARPYDDVADPAARTSALSANVDVPPTAPPSEARAGR